MKFLICDDSSMMRKSLIRTLHNFDISNIVEAKDGKDAMSLLSSENPDVITLDITMPEMDGIEALSQIRSINESVSIIIISALNDKPTMIKCLDMGADYFLTKPLDMDEFEEAITDIKDEFERN